MKKPLSGLRSVLISVAIVFTVWAALFVQPVMPASVAVPGAEVPEYKEDKTGLPGEPGRQKKEAIKKGEKLNLKQCIEIAVENQPLVAAAMNNASVVESRVAQAGANYYPWIDLSSGYTRTSAAGGSSGRFAGNGAFDQYIASAALKQNIYDFGKTSSQVMVQRHNLDASRADLEGVLVQSVFNVKQAYYALLQAKRTRDVATESVRRFEAHLEQARGFYEAGTKPKFDVTKADVDLSNAKVGLIKAENALKIARVNLDNAMGVPGAPEYSIEDDLEFQKYEITLEEAMKKAFDARPDMRSAVARRRSAEEGLALSKSGYYPAITGSAAYNREGEGFPLQEGWNAGATVTFPLFSGFLTKYQVEEAKATLNATGANEESLRQGVILEVQQAYLSLKEAEEMVPAAELALKQATENLDIANGRYAAGVGNPLEVTDAQVSYTNARTAFIQALSDYKVAHASLDKAMGVR
ncbi:MAG: TolC family protein [Deltaproteobacteria bacterium]|nr:TolC family protein [Deltaproteobacteria bacterium]